MDRQFSVGRVFRDAFGLYGERLGRLLATAAVVFLAGLAGTAMVTFIGAGLGSLVGLQIVGVGLGLAFGVALFLAANAAYNGFVIKLAECQHRRVEPAPIMETLKALGPRIWPMIWIQLVVAVLVICGLILFVIPGIWLLVIWSVVLPVIVLEGRGFDSLGHSRELVRGNGWSVFGVGVIYVSAAIVINVLQSVLQAALGQAVAGVFSIATSILLLPAGAILSSFVYFELVRDSGAGEGDQLPAVDEPVALTPPPPAPASLAPPTPPTPPTRPTPPAPPAPPGPPAPPTPPAPPAPPVPPGPPAPPEPPEPPA